MNTMSQPFVKFRCPKCKAFMYLRWVNLDVEDIRINCGWCGFEEKEQVFLYTEDGEVQ